jgi:hypothetical protein
MRPAVATRSVSPDPLRNPLIRWLASVIAILITLRIAVCLFIQVAPYVLALIAVIAVIRVYRWYCGRW